MKTYIALFRGINVGGRGLLPMKDLVRILEGLGFAGVKTYIQSGNAVFQSARPKTAGMAGEISAAIMKSHGFAPAVMLLEVADLQRAVDNNPFREAEGKALHLFFLERQPAKPDLKGLTALRTTSEEFKLGKTVFYLHTPDGFGRSKLAAGVERGLGVPVTARNWNTVSKLLSMAMP
jgi:uncharacterized protein (DUF1697 family)